MRKLKTLQCITCHKHFQTRLSRTGKCFNCSRSHPFGEETRRKISQSKMAEKNPMWKNHTEIRLTTLHEWVIKRIPKPDMCPRCGVRPTLDLSNMGIYDRNLDNWEWLCRHCHMAEDGRLKNLTSYRR